MNATATSPFEAKVSWTVPSIAFTNESYYIEYESPRIGIGSREATPWITGNNNVSTQQRTYALVLDGLEDGFRYQYQVVAVNCFGMSRSNIQHFTTFPTSRF